MKKDSLKKYEMMYIIRSGLSEARYKEIEEKFTSILDTHGGFIVETTVMGMRDIAETFKDARRGFYIVSIFEATRKSIDELYGWIKVEEDIIRHLNVLYDSISPQTIEEKEKLVEENEAVVAA